MTILAADLSVGSKTIVVDGFAPGALRHLGDSRIGLEVDGEMLVLEQGQRPRLRPRSPEGDRPAGLIYRLAWAQRRVWAQPVTVLLDTLIFGRPRAAHIAGAEVTVLGRVRLEHWNGFELKET